MLVNEAWPMTLNAKLWRYFSAGTQLPVVHQWSLCRADQCRSDFCVSAIFIFLFLPSFPIQGMFRHNSGVAGNQRNILAGLENIMW